MDYREYRKKYGGQTPVAPKQTGAPGPAASPDRERRSPGTERDASGYRQAPRANEAAPGNPAYEGYGTYSAPGEPGAERRLTRTYGTKKADAGRIGKKKKTNKNSASGRLIRVMIIVLTLLLILMSSLLLLTDYKIWLPGYVASKVTVEAGRRSIKATDFLTDKSHTAEFAEESVTSMLSRVGIHKIKLTIDGTRSCTTRLEVRDSVAPTGKPNSITVRRNSNPAASLCVTDVVDATKVSCSFKSKPDLSQIGTVPVTVILEDEGGNRTVIDSEITVVEDAKILTSLKKIEAGERIPDVSVFVGTDGEGEYGGDISLVNTSVPGYYTISVMVAGEAFDVTLVVQDTVAPKATVKPQVIYNDGDFPAPERFVSEINDATAVTVSYDTEPKKSGEPPYAVKIRLTDAGGNRTIYDSYCTTATDHTPPTVTVLSETIEFNVGDTALIWRSGVRASDNTGEPVDLSLDTSAVNLQLAGTYTAYYVATDPAGNETRKRVTIVVQDSTISTAMLNAAAKALADTLVNGTMTDLQKMSAIYNYLSANTVDKMKYVNSSPHDDWMREAYLALTTRRSGDCFAFASVAQAIFRYLGYETVMVQRSEAAQRQAGGTHYWIMVNLGTQLNPLWYHFDATPQRGDYRIKAYCLTDAQIDAYTRWRNAGIGPNQQYYAYDKSLYPKSSDKVLVNITNIPSQYYN